MKLARLTPKGIAAFTHFLDNIQALDSDGERKKILESPDLIRRISGQECIEVDHLPTSKLGIAIYLNELLDTADLSTPEKDVGLWAWLSLFYFEAICKKKKSGDYHTGKIYRWIPDPQNYQTYYRHLLAGPWRICRAYKDNPDVLVSILSGDITTPGDFYEQLASRQEFISNSSIIELATYLYFDRNKNELKKGAAGKGEGSARRLVGVINQFSRTWDLYGMGYKDIAKLLPDEFNKYVS